MSCATAAIKYLVLIFNTLCALLGIGTIVVNALALENVEEEGELVCIFMIVLGSIVFVISFFGCCGALRENTCFTWTYASLLLILIVCNSVLMFGYISHIDGEAHARKELDKAWSKQLNGTDAMSFYQAELGCCGKQNYTDYVTASLPIPDSCYVNSNSSDSQNMTNLYEQGCLQKLIELYESAELLVVIFSWTTLAVEAVALICACILAISFRNQQRRSRY